MTLGIVLLLIQFAAALPWLLALTWRTAPLPNRVGAGPAKGFSPLLVLGGGLVAAVGLGALLGLYLGTGGDRESVASSQIPEEREARTAIPLLSKPVSRRQFLLGKFLGIFLCALMMVLAVGWLFDLVLLYKRWFDSMDPVVLDPEAAAWVESLG